MLFLYFYSFNCFYIIFFLVETKPMKMFDRTANLANNKVINYQCFPMEKWLVLIGIAPGDRIFVQMSAKDHIMAGQSTFLIEPFETAVMLVRFHLEQTFCYIKLQNCICYSCNGSYNEWSTCTFNTREDPIKLPSFDLKSLASYVYSFSSLLPSYAINILFMLLRLFLLFLCS